MALGLPPILGLASEASIPVLPAFALPISVLLVLAPLVAAQALVEVALVRWFSSPRLRFWVTLAQVTGVRTRTAVQHDPTAHLVVRHRMVVKRR
ncbi:MAG: hypothetical protein AAF628_36350 [Planctomycetota bacterium]